MEELQEHLPGKMSPGQFIESQPGATLFQKQENAMADLEREIRFARREKDNTLLKLTNYYTGPWGRLTYGQMPPELVEHRFRDVLDKYADSGESAEAEKMYENAEKDIQRTIRISQSLAEYVRQQREAA